MQAPGRAIGCRVDADTLGVAVAVAVAATAASSSRTSPTPVAGAARGTLGNALAAAPTPGGQGARHAGKRLGEGAESSSPGSAWLSRLVGEARPQERWGAAGERTSARISGSSLEEINPGFWKGS